MKLEIEKCNNERRRFICTLDNLLRNLTSLPTYKDLYHNDEIKQAVIELIIKDRFPQDEHDLDSKVYSSWSDLYSSMEYLEQQYPEIKEKHK